MLLPIAHAASSPLLFYVMCTLFIMHQFFGHGSSTLYKQLFAYRYGTPACMFIAYSNSRLHQSTSLLFATPSHLFSLSFARALFSHFSRGLFFFLCFGAFSLSFRGLNTIERTGVSRFFFCGLLRLLHRAWFSCKAESSWGGEEMPPSTRSHYFHFLSTHTQSALLSNEFGVTSWREAKMCEMRERKNK